MKKKRSLHYDHSIRASRPSKFAAVAAIAAQEYAHASTEDVARKLSSVGHEVTLIEDEISTLQARLNDARQRKARAEAEVAGLASVVEKR